MLEIEFRLEEQALKPRHISEAELAEDLRFPCNDNLGMVYRNTGFSGATPLSRHSHVLKQGSQNFVLLQQGAVLPCSLPGHG